MEEDNSNKQVAIKVEKKKCEEQIPLYPGDLRNLKNSLKSYVSKKLFKWDYKLQGIIL